MLGRSPCLSYPDILDCLPLDVVDHYYAVIIHVEVFQPGDDLLVQALLFHHLEHPGKTEESNTAIRSVSRMPHQDDQAC